jgi:hypothetical protein
MTSTRRYGMLLPLHLLAYIRLILQPERLLLLGRPTATVLLSNSYPLCKESVFGKAELGIEFPIATLLLKGIPYRLAGIMKHLANGVAACNRRLSRT